MKIAEQVNASLIKEIDKICVTKYKEKEFVKVIEEILTLPIWKHRYDLYATWVCTKIIDSFENYKIQYNVYDGKLSFSFKGSLIASVVDFEPQLQIWTELKTEWKNGHLKNRKSRKNNIQPDYSLVINPIEDIESTVAVVECKQYKNGVRKNFTEALEDYSDGRPNSNIILMNYGKLPKDLIGRMQSNNKDRQYAYGYFIPKSSDIKELNKLIIDTTKDYYKDILGKEISIKLDTSKPLNIALRWNEKPKDLNLHLCIQSEGSKLEEIFYGKKRK